MARLHPRPHLRGRSPWLDVLSLPMFQSFQTGFDQYNPFMNVLAEEVLTDPVWPPLGDADRAALSPLVHHHVNPYDRFGLGLNISIWLDNSVL